MSRLALLALVLICATASAMDVVELKSGTVLEGKIVREENHWVGLETADGVTWIKPDEILSIKRGVETPKPAKKDPAPEQPKPETERTSDEISKTPPTREPSPEQPKRRDAGDAPTTSAATADSSTGTSGAAADKAAEEVAVARMVEALGSTERERRVAAIEWILSTWPRWSVAVERAIESGNRTARLEAVRLLDSEALGDTRALLARPLRDSEAAVVVAALRVARHRGYTDFESEAIRLMRVAPHSSIRTEAVRALEDIGGVQCLPHVLNEYARFADDRNEQRRLRRVLRALLGDAAGNDVEGWRRAADEVARGERNVRKLR